MLLHDVFVKERFIMKQKAILSSLLFYPATICSQFKGRSLGIGFNSNLFQYKFNVVLNEAIKIAKEVYVLKNQSNKDKKNCDIQMT